MYESHRIVAVSQTYALIDFQGKLYAVDLRKPEHPQRSVAVPGSGVQAVFLDKQTAAVMSGDVFKKIYLLSLKSMTLTESPTSKGVATPQGDKVISVTATQYRNPAWGGVSGYLLAIRDVKTGNTTYQNFSGADQEIGLLGLLQFKIDAISPKGDSVLVRGPGDMAYVFSLKDSNKHSPETGKLKRFMIF